MRVDSHRFVAGQFGATIFVLLLSALVALLMWHLWPAMWIPVFVAQCVGWTFSIGGQIERTYRTRDLTVRSRAETAEELAFSWGDLKRRDRRAWLNFIESSGVILTSCFVIASLLTGLAGLFLPDFRWRIFLVAQAFWFFVAIAAIAGGRARIRDGQRGW